MLSLAKMMSQSSEFFEELREQVKDLDAGKFKVMLMWDPDASEDIGWLIVRKDVQVDLSKFQVRDVNYSKLLSAQQVTASPPTQPSKDKQANREQETTSTNNRMDIEEINHPHDVFNDTNENKMDILDEKESVHNVSGPSMKSQSKQPKVSKSPRRRCPECQVEFSIKSLFPHLKKVHNITPDRTRVRCDVCGHHMLKFNLEFHKSTAHSAEESIEGDETISPLTHGSSEKSKVAFKIIYQGRHFDCHRRTGSTIKGALRKFCKQVGKDLQFEFSEKLLTGDEKTEEFEGGTIAASDIGT